MEQILDKGTIDKWSESGSRLISSKLSKCIIAKVNNIKEQWSMEGLEINQILYELVWAALKGKLARQDAITLLKEVKQSSTGFACDIFCDVLWIVGNEVETSEKGRERHTSSEWLGLSKLVKLLADEDVVPMIDLRASLEIDLLHDAGLAPEPQMLSKKIIRVNTKALYTQNKYNLLREESEGFSKVLCLLHTGMNNEQVDASRKDLLALIGFFDLDPNRVLDLVLDAYEMHPENECYIGVLREFKKVSLAHIVGFKFQFYTRDGGVITTPQSLYRLAAILIHHGLLEIDDLLPHLSPTREDIIEQFQKHAKKLEAAAKSFGKVNLAAKSSENDEVSCESHDSSLVGANQVFGLIGGLVEIGSVSLGFEMIKWFRARDVDPLMFSPLARVICELLHSKLKSLFNPLSKRHLGFSFSNGKQEAKLVPHADSMHAKEELTCEVLPVVKILGNHLYHDPFLFHKLVKVCLSVLEGKSRTDDSSVWEIIEGMLIDVFLPSLSHLKSNPSICFTLWDVVKRFSFDQRYRMYHKWQEYYKSSPEMLLIEAQGVQNTRKIMRRLTADRAKASSRSLTHIAHSNPIVVFGTMLRQIQSYDNLIQPVVESFKFVTPLGMDVLSYVLVSELSKSRQSMKSDGTNISLWLSSLANFSGSFYRKYPNVELGGLLQYLIKRLQNWESVDLVVLSELLSKMGSCLSFEDISDSQLESYAGGPHLWHEPADPKLMNRRAIPRLRDALIKRNLALPICVLICQTRSKIEYQEESAPAHLKLLGRLYDTCQMTFNQLLQFLNGAVDPYEYAKMIPQFSVLVQEYHVSSELAMAICRPAIRCYDEILRKTPRSVIGPTSSEVVNATYAARWKMYSKELLDDIHIALRSESDETLFVGMNKEMYVTFWSSVLYDIHVPFPQYEAEIARLRNAVTIGSVSGQLTASERKKAKEKTTQLIEKLINEQKDQVNHRKKVFERLEQKKTSFFVNGLQNHDTIIELLQKCVLPRVLLSPEDALFTAKFMERLHQINTPGFSTLQYYHMINLKLPTMVLCVTEREAGNFGIFLKESLSLLLRWYQNITLYEEGAIGKVGFSLDSNKMLGHRQFKKMYSKWHKWMEKVYATTLQSEEYMQIRNTLIVLTKVIDVFPSNKSTAVRLLQIVEVLTNEDREDIKIMAKRYYALLGKQKTVLLEDKLLSTAASTAAVVAANAKKKASEEAVAKKKRDSSPSHSVQGEESRSSSSKKTDSERQSVNTRHDDQRGSRDSTRTFSEHHRKGREKDRERSEDRRQELERISDSVIVLESNPKEKEPTRKKQRVELELTEEELRRQLTEKKEQEKRKSDEKVEMGKSKGDDNETRGVAGKVVSISYRKRERDTNSGEDREHVNQANISKNKRDGDKGQQKQHHSEKRAQDEKKKKHNANLKSDRSQNNRDSRNSKQDSLSERQRHNGSVGDLAHSQSPSGSSRRRDDRRHR